MNSTGYGAQQRLLFDGDESRYEQWEVKILAYMKLRKLKNVILGEVVSNADKREEAFSELVQFLDDRSLNLIMRDAKDDGKKALEILRQHYAGSGKQRIISLYTQLTSLQKQHQEELTDYIIRAETSATALKSAGEIVSDGLLIAMVLKGLSNVYKPFVVVITQAEKPMTFQEFKVSLRNYEENEKACSSNNNENNKVMKARHQQYNPRSRFINNENNDSVMRIENKNHRRSAGFTVTCFSCGESGHKSNECRNKPTNGNYTNAKTHNNNNNRKWCSNCKSSTHTNKTCRNSNKQYHHNMNNKDAAKFANAGNVIHDDEKHSFDLVFGLSDVLCSVNHEEKIQADLLLVDCGATAHIVNDDSKFIYIDEKYNPEEHFIELADGKRCNNVAKKRGTVIVEIRDENGEMRKASLENALYVPSYPQNIFSVRAAAEKGATVQLGANSGELITSKGLRFPIQTIGRLYYLNMCKSSDIVSSDRCSSISEGCKSSPDIISKDSSDKVSKRSSSLEGWHKILGHVNKSDILKLENVVDDMKITKKENSSSCTTCILSKQTLNRNRQPDKRAITPLELVHTDIGGPVEPIAKDGFRYIINFVDDYSSAIFVYFLKNKSDAFHALRNFLSDSAPYGKVKRLRSDNGGEFVSHQFEAETLSNRFKHEFTAPHSPHQNGTAERNWRTLLKLLDVC